MAKIGTIEAEIKINTTGLEKGIMKATSKMQAFSKKFVSIAKKTAKLAATALAAIGTVSLKIASDFAETEAKFNTAFSGIEKKADQVAKSLGKNYKMSQLESKRLLSSTGDLLKGFGFTADEALNLSGKVQELSADLASYNNLQGGTTRASEILTKAMLGERESLTQVGIKILETDVKQRLLEKGLSDLTGQALLAAKAQATFELALQQSGDALGDMERTGGSLVNQIKELKANLVDIAIKIGNKLLPVAIKIATAFNNFLDSEAGKNLVNALAGGFEGFVKVLGKVIKKVITFFDDVDIKFKIFVSKLKIKWIEFLKFFSDMLKPVVNIINSLLSKIGLDNLKIGLDIAGFESKIKELENIISANEDILLFRNSKRDSSGSQGGKVPSEIDVTAKVQSDWAKFIKKIKDSLSNVSSVTDSKFKSLTKKVSSYILDVEGQFNIGKIEGGSGYGQAAFKVAKDGVIALAGGISKLSSGLGSVMEMIGPVGQGISQIFSGNILGGIVQILGESEQFKSFMEKLSPILQNIANTVGAVLSPVLDMLIPVFEGLAGVAKTAAKWTTKLSIFILKGVKLILGAFEGLINGILWLVDQIPFVDVGRVNLTKDAEQGIGKLEGVLRDLDSNNTNVTKETTDAVKQLNASLFNVSGSVNADVLRARALQGINVNVSLQNGTSAKATVSTSGGGAALRVNNLTGTRL